MSADSWGDEPTEETPPPAPLPKWLIELRDGTAPPSPNAGIARQQNLARMEREDAELGDIVTDCDRYSTFMQSLESPCVHPFVPRMMGHYLDEMRRKTLARRRQLRAELSILRKAGS